MRTAAWEIGPQRVLKSCFKEILVKGEYMQSSIYIYICIYIYIYIYL